MIAADVLERPLATLRLLLSIAATAPASSTAGAPTLPPQVAQFAKLLADTLPAGGGGLATAAPAPTGRAVGSADARMLAELSHTVADLDAHQRESLDETVAQIAQGMQARLQERASVLRV